MKRMKCQECEVIAGLLVLAGGAVGSGRRWQLSIWGVFTPSVTFVTVILGGEGVTCARVFCARLRMAVAYPPDQTSQMSHNK